MQNVLECSESIVFNWCEAVVVNMEGQLMREDNGRLKNFSYGDIMIYSSLERIPLLRPQNILVDEIGSQDP